MKKAKEQFLMILRIFLLNKESEAGDFGAKVKPPEDYASFDRVGPPPCRCTGAVGEDGSC